MLAPFPDRTAITDNGPRVTTLAWVKWLRDLRDAVNGTISGFGSPAGVIVADVGTLYRRLDGGVSTTLYIKEADSGLSSGWRAV